MDRKTRIYNPSIFRLILGHTRVVTSGSYPLYRLVALAAVASGVLQIATGKVPDSLANVIDGTPRWIDYGYTIMMTLGGLLVIIGLYLKRHVELPGGVPEPSTIHVSLTLELIGLLFLTTTTVIYIYAVVINNSGPPVAYATWLGIVAAFYFFRRMNEIRLKLRRLRK